jgi:hypothetical protein
MDDVTVSSSAEGRELSSHLVCEKSLSDFIGGNAPGERLLGLRFPRKSCETRRGYRTHPTALATSPIQFTWRVHKNVLRGQQLQLKMIMEVESDMICLSALPLVV